jgi:hypothetical protein
MVVKKGHGRLEGVRAREVDPSLVPQARAENLIAERVLARMSVAIPMCCWRDEHEE